MTAFCACYLERIQYHINAHVIHAHLQKPSRFTSIQTLQKTKFPLANPND